MEPEEYTFTAREQEWFSRCGKLNTPEHAVEQTIRMMLSNGIKGSLVCAFLFRVKMQQDDRQPLGHAYENAWMVYRRYFAKECDYCAGNDIVHVGKSVHISPDRWVD